MIDKPLRLERVLFYRCLISSDADAFPPISGGAEFTLFGAAQRQGDMRRAKTLRDACNRSSR